MQNYNSKFKTFENVRIFILDDEQKETSQKLEKIHSKREGEDSQRNFGFGRTRKTNSRVISKIF
jgi:hypothetical protein